MRWLLDEMLPRATCKKLQDLGHDALSVQDAGLGGAEDERVFDFAVRDARLIVTENFADYAILLERRLSRGEPCVPVVFIRKSSFPQRGTLATRLARRLHEWSEENADPYVGPHWA
jgi:predicted nuclease of predicted toxin-antitoxin system